MKLHHKRQSCSHSDESGYFLCAMGVLKGVGKAMFCDK